MFEISLGWIPWRIPGLILGGIFKEFWNYKFMKNHVRNCFKNSGNNDWNNCRKKPWEIEANCGKILEEIHGVHRRTGIISREIPGKILGGILRRVL